jgi:hypothetical protein
MAILRSRRHVIHYFSANKDFTGRGSFQSGDHAQESGLSGTGWPQKNQKLAFTSFQVHIIDGSQLSFFEYLG